MRGGFLVLRLLDRIRGFGILGLRKLGGVEINFFFC